MYYFEQIISKIDKYLKFIKPLLKLEAIVLGIGLASGFGFNVFTTIHLAPFHFYLWVLVSLVISVLLIIIFWNEDLDTKFIKDV